MKSNLSNRMTITSIWPWSIHTSFNDLDPFWRSQEIGNTTTVVFSILDASTPNFYPWCFCQAIVRAIWMHIWKSILFVLILGWKISTSLCGKFVRFARFHRRVCARFCFELNSSHGSWQWCTRVRIIMSHLKKKDVFLHCLLSSLFLPQNCALYSFL